MKKKNLEWGTRLYRLFLLSIMFSVLWVKEYLWSAFILALLLFLGDTFIVPMLQVVSNMPPDYSAPRRTKSPRPTTPSSTARTNEDAASPPAGGGDDFREPMPGRSSPRRKGSLNDTSSRQRSKPPAHLPSRLLSSRARKEDLLRCCPRSSRIRASAASLRPDRSASSQRSTSKATARS